MSESLELVSVIVFTAFGMYVILTTLLNLTEKGDDE